MNYISDDAKNRPILGDGAGNSNFQVLLLPTSVDVNTLNPASSGTITEQNIKNGYKGLGGLNDELLFANNTYATNPWFAADKL